MGRCPAGWTRPSWQRCGPPIWPAGGGARRRRYGRPCARGTGAWPRRAPTKRSFSGSRTTCSTISSSPRSTTGWRDDPGPLTLVSLPHERPESLEQAFSDRRPHRPDPARFAALRSPDPRDWLRFDELVRLAEELPDRRTGLSRLEREIAEALAAGPLHPPELFAQVAARERPPWIGDAPLWALADDLAPLVGRNGSGYELSEQGRSVLAGESRRPPPERWLGGVQLGPGRPAWAWDAEAKTVVQLN